MGPEAPVSPERGLAGRTQRLPCHAGAWAGQFHEIDALDPGRTPCAGPFSDGRKQALACLQPVTLGDALRDLRP